MNLFGKTLRKAHLIGVKGAGMTALAEVFSARGVTVTGSDTAEVFFTDEVLRRSGIVPIEGFDGKNIPSDVDLIVYSTAYGAHNNPELKEALERSAGTDEHASRTASYPETVGEIMRGTLGLTVCGTHGKTTTSALLAEVLRAAGEDPLAIIGSRITQWGGNALAGQGKYFVLEADEYQNKLRHYAPFGAILTSVDWDHPDFFPDFSSYRKAFSDAVARIPHQGVLVAWGDSANVLDTIDGARCHRLTYGFLEGNDFRVVNYTPMSDFVQDGAYLSLKQMFEVLHGDESLGVFALQLAGRHNALNAAAVIALCAFLKIDAERIREGLKHFAGTSRRFEYVGEFHGAALYDDYAHHPEEIKATLRAFRDVYPTRRLLTVFHPHTFTRTKALLTEFAQSFDDADVVYVVDIYGSAREVQGGVSSRELVDLINSYQRGKATYIPTIAEVTEELRARIAPGDVVSTLGAGNVWEVVHNLVKSR
jgi:UDP-N-acetylmuramate--alanine ligase